MNTASDYRDFLNTVRSSIGYWKSYSLLQFTLSFTRIMRLDKVSGRKLAASLNISAAQVSKVLKGNENVTIETMVKFADAIGSAVHIHVAKKGIPVQWSELPETSATTLVAPKIETHLVSKLQPQKITDLNVWRKKARAASASENTFVSITPQTALEENYGRTRLDGAL